MADQTRGMSPEEAAAKQAEEARIAAEGPPPVRGAAPPDELPPELKAAMMAQAPPPPRVPAHQGGQPPQYAPPPVPAPDDMAGQINPDAWKEPTQADLDLASADPIAQQAMTAPMAPPGQQPSQVDLLIAEAELQAVADQAAIAQLSGTPPKTYSASLIGWAEKCMLAAKMSRKNDPGGEMASLGTAVHEVLAALDFKAQFEQREYIGEAEALEVADRVLRGLEDSQGPLTREGYFELLDMVATWASMTRFSWEGIVQSELPVRTELNGLPLTGRIDRLEIVGTHARIRDYKTGGFLPNEEEMRKRTQTPIYAWHIWMMYPHVQTFECVEEYLRYGTRRFIELDAYEVSLLTGYLEVAVERIRNAFLNDATEPTPGSHCAYCPAPMECPLPETRRLESIQTMEDAVAMGEEMVVLDARRSEISKALQAFLDRDAQGFLYVGDYRIGYEEKTERSFDKKAVAKQLPEGTSIDDFYEVKHPVKFSKRKRKEGEGG